MQLSTNLPFHHDIMYCKFQPLSIYLIPVKTFLLAGLVISLFQPQNMTFCFMQFPSHILSSNITHGLSHCPMLLLNLTSGLPSKFITYLYLPQIGLKNSPLHPHKQTLLAFLLVLIPNGPSTTCLHHQNLISGFIC